MIMWGGDPVNFVDLSGLRWAPDEGGGAQGVMHAFDGQTSATAIFLDTYFDMRDANFQNQDKYFHCKANCLATIANFEDAAESLSNFREWADETFKGDSPTACQADQVANKWGREKGKKYPNLTCPQVCNTFRPPKLPIKY